MIENQALEIGTVLKGKDYQYRIEKVLGQGSFGITYLATLDIKGSLGTIHSNTRVAIKEFFMREINDREGTDVSCGSKGGLFGKYKQKFAREATNLSHLEHPNIINVLEAFEENNTAYYVMEYIDGCNLNEYVDMHQGLSEAEGLKYIRQIASALSYMHSRRMLHLDLKPSNVMLRRSGDSILIDFGLSKQYDSDGMAETATSVGGGTKGYAPIEQSDYHEGKEFAVSMDIYALGATLFKMLSGVRPPDASTLLNEDFPRHLLAQKGISEATIACIEKAMSPTKKYRYASVADFITALTGERDDETTEIFQSEQTEIYPAAKPLEPVAPKPKPAPAPAPKPTPTPKAEVEPKPSTTDAQTAYIPAFKQRGWFINLYLLAGFVVTIFLSFWLIGGVTESISRGSSTNLIIDKCVPILSICGAFHYLCLLIEGHKFRWYAPLIVWGISCLMCYIATFNPPTLLVLLLAITLANWVPQVILRIKGKSGQSTMISGRLPDFTFRNKDRNAMVNLAIIITSGISLFVMAVSILNLLNGNYMDDSYADMLFAISAITIASYGIYLLNRNAIIGPIVIISSVILQVIANEISILGTINIIVYGGMLLSLFIRKDGKSAWSLLR